MATVRLRAHLDGLGDVHRVIDRAVDACQPPSITDSLEAGADVYEQGARERAPRLSGELAWSIQRTPAGPYAWEIGSDLIYAVITEFGGSIRPKGRGRRGRLRYSDGGATYYDTRTYVPAQPYIIPTFEQDTPKAIEAVESAIAAAIRS